MRKELCVKMTTRGKMLLNLVDKSFEQDRPSLNEGLVTSKSDEVVVVSEPNLPLTTDQGAELLFELHLPVVDQNSK